MFLGHTDGRKAMEVRGKKVEKHSKHDTLTLQKKNGQMGRGESPLSSLDHRLFHSPQYRCGEGKRKKIRQNISFPLFRRWAERTKSFQHGFFQLSNTPPVSPLCFFVRVIMTVIHSAGLVVKSWEVLNHRNLQTRSRS